MTRSAGVCLKKSSLWLSRLLGTSVSLPNQQWPDQQVLVKNIQDTAGLLQWRKLSELWSSLAVDAEQLSILSVLQQTCVQPCFARLFYY